VRYSGRIIKLRVFVTGATGFIGRVFVGKLIERGDEVVALVRDKNHNLPKGVNLAYGDIMFRDSLKEAGRGCKMLYHLAAIVSFNREDSTQLILVNGQGTFNVLSASLGWGVEKAVVLSSACAMGLSRRREILLDENSQPTRVCIRNNPYLQSKLLAESHAFSFTDRLKVVVVNPSTVYGPGDWRLNSGTLIKNIAGSSVVPVPSGGGNVVDVEDAAEAIILAGEKGVSGKRYIVGGHNMLFKDIFEDIACAIQRHPAFILLPPWARLPMSFSAGFFGRFINRGFVTPQIINDMFLFRYYSTRLALEELGFRPRYTFRESLDRAWAFYLVNGLIT